MPHLEEADDDGEGHEEVDDGVGDIDDEDGDEVEVLLVDQGEVEDESDRQGHQGKKPCKNNMYQIRRPLGLVFVIYFWWLGDLLPLYI